MRYFSMFSGIGGFDLALNRLGHQCIGYSEIDKHAISVYKYRFGEEVHNYGDATTIIPGNIPDFELLCGGFPCQAFSVAGQRKGFEDTRGTLFFEVARIAQVKRPRYLFLENVKGLLNHDEGRTFATIISAIWELGYDVEWGVCNSRYFGVPQNRERVFIIGRLRGDPGSKVFPLRREGTGFDGKNQSTAIAVLTPDRLEKRQNGRRFKEAGEPMFTLNAQDHHGILQINDPKYSHQRVYDPVSISPTLRAGNPGGGKSPSIILQLNNPIHSIDRVYLEEGLSPTLNTMQGGLRQPFVIVGYSRSSDGISHHLKDVAGTIKGGASGKTSNQSEYVMIDVYNKRLRKESPTLTDPCHNSIRVMQDYNIRRLTPLECERLQGFPDGWTSEGMLDSGSLIPISDTQRYKMCGNAVTVSVVEAIASVAWGCA